jgi:hypothetical protein
MFRTAASQKKLKTDDSNLRMDYKHVCGRAGQVEVRRAFAQIERLLVHEPFEGGPKRLVVEGVWYRPQGDAPSGNKLVSKDRAYCFNQSSKFAFLSACYQIPVAVWPYDPLNLLPDAHRWKNCYEIIDKNQDEYNA